MAGKAHQQKLYFASGAPGASDAWGVLDAKCNSGSGVADAFRLGANIMRPGAPGATRTKFLTPGAPVGKARKTGRNHNTSGFI